MHQILIVLIIHRYDEVEIKEIQTGNLTGPMCQAITSVHSRIPHPAVRKFSPVTAIGSGRIRLDPVLHPVFPDNMFKNSLSRRRPADVPQAHEKDFVFIIDIQIVLIIHIFMVYTTVYNIFYCIFSKSLQRYKKFFYARSGILVIYPRRAHEKNPRNHSITEVKELFLSMKIRSFAMIGR